MVLNLTCEVLGLVFFPKLWKQVFSFVPEKELGGGKSCKVTHVTVKYIFFKINLSVTGYEVNDNVIIHVLKDLYFTKAVLRA